MAEPAGASMFGRPKRRGQYLPCTGHPARQRHRAPGLLPVQIAGWGCALDAVTRRWGGPLGVSVSPRRPSPVARGPQRDPVRPQTVPRATRSIWPRLSAFWPEVGLIPLSEDSRELRQLLRAALSSIVLYAILIPMDSLQIITIPAGPLRPTSGSVPALFMDAGSDAVRRFIESFTANIRNRNTRAAYARAVARFAR